MVKGGLEGRTSASRNTRNALCHVPKIFVEHEGSVPGPCPLVIIQVQLRSGFFFTCYFTLTYLCSAQRKVRSFNKTSLARPLARSAYLILHPASRPKNPPSRSPLYPPAALTKLGSHVRLPRVHHAPKISRGNKAHMNDPPCCSSLPPFLFKSSLLLSLASLTCLPPALLSLFSKLLIFIFTFSSCLPFSVFLSPSPYPCL